MDKSPPNWDKLQIAKDAPFLQSSYWGSFQAQLGIKPHYLSGDGWSCLLLEKQNRIGTYLFSQYGPTVDSIDSLKTAVNDIKKYGQQHKVAWLSLEPMSAKVDSPDIKSAMQQLGAKPAARHREPNLTRIVELTAKPDEMLATISQSTRSFIRKNQREKFINFQTSTDPSDITVFTKMLNLIARRENIYFYTDEYFKKQAQVLMPAGMMYLELALMEGQPVASALIHDYGMTSTYTYAASLPEARKTNTSALLLWQAMMNAKQRGSQKIDLYGIAPDNASSSHPWAGFTSFKAKFGGQVVQLPGTWDIALNSRYQLYRGAHQVRKLIKRS